jgi:hypothetical protein
VPFGRAGGRAFTVLNAISLHLGLSADASAEARRAKVEAPKEHRREA